jgi:predicted transcriptional regulator YheO
MLQSENKQVQNAGSGSEYIRRSSMLDHMMLDSLKQVANGISATFGDNCETVIHDLTSPELESSIVYIVNGHVSNRKVGDGPSQIVLDALRHSSDPGEDKLSYLTRTHDGRILKSSTIYIRDGKGKAVAILAINYDLTSIIAVQNVLSSITSSDAGKESSSPSEPADIPLNVNELLDELITQSIKLIGKPVSSMTKDDKIKAIRYLNEAGAFLITKSGDKVSKTFGISKFTLYSYMDAGK